MNPVAGLRWQHLPGILLCLSLPLILIWRESDSLYWNSISVRVIPMMIGVLSIALLQLALPRPAREYISRPVYLLTELFLVCALISTILGPSASAGIARFTELVILALYAMTLRAYLIENPEFRRYLFFSLTAVAIVIVAVFLHYWYQLEDPYNHWWTGELPLFDHIRHMSYLLALCIPLAFWLWHDSSRLQKIYVFCFFSMCWGMMFWSAGRGAFLGAATATLVYLILQPRSAIWVIGGILVGVFLADLFPVASSHLDMFRNLQARDSTFKTADSITAGRIQIYLKTLTYWWEHFPFWGGGADSFRPLAVGLVNQSIVQPHSVMVQIIFSYGFPGLILLGALFVIYLMNVVKSKRMDYIIALPVLSVFINSLSDGNFYHSVSLFLSITLMVIAAPVTDKAESHQNAEPGIKARLFNFNTFVWIVCLLMTINLLAQIILSRHVMPPWYYFWQSLIPLYY